MVGAVDRRFLSSEQEQKPAREYKGPAIGDGRRDDFSPSCLPHCDQKLSNTLHPFSLLCKCSAPARQLSPPFLTRAFHSPTLKFLPDLKRPSWLTP